MEKTGTTQIILILAIILIHSHISPNHMQPEHGLYSTSETKPPTHTNSADISILINNFRT